MAKSQKFSVRLLKEEYDFTKACKNIDDLELIVQDDIYSVYLCPDNPQTPWWKGFLGIDRELYNHSNSAILTIKVRNRTFVYTFGMSHTKIKTEYCEDNFGFLVTINSINGEKLKSIDAYSPASNTKQKRVVSSILSNIYEYDFNDNQDLVQKLSGIIKDEYKYLFTNPTGADSLSITSKCSKEDLVNISSKLLDRFTSSDYERDPYLKNINKIKKATQEEINTLNDILLQKINNHDYSDIYMADFEILEFEQFYAYKFGNSEFFDLSLEHIELGQDLTLDKLKSLKISVLKTKDDQNPTQWNLYKCLSFDYNNTFLSKGTIYVINHDFLEEVNNFLETYKIDNFLPLANHEEKEGDYNIRISDNVSLILFDAKCPNIEGHSKVEICDIYDCRSQLFIHIKKSERSSSLSHLWAQGVISEQLANSGNLAFSNKFKEIAGIDIPETRNIYYGIIKKSESLPIFSKISLYNNIKILRSMGKEECRIKYFYIGINHH